MVMSIILNPFLIIIKLTKNYICVNYILIYIIYFILYIIYINLCKLYNYLRYGYGQTIE